MSETTGHIGFDHIGIGNVLNRHALRVPVNQREYSWEERHVKALFQDLAKAISENAPEYFLGTIVGIPGRTDTLEIVDGQQRLATTAILLAGIRDYLAKRPDDKLLVEHVESSFLTTIDPEARERVSRLRLNTTDSVYFEQRVLDSDASVAATALSHRLIHGAAILARDHVKAIVRPHREKDHGDVLTTWIRFVQNKALVMLLRVPTAVNAYRMFETLNDRGLKTSQADLVKNYLFGESGEERLGEAQQKWSSMKALLESLDDEDITITFLRQMLISFYGQVRDSEMYEKVQKNARGVAGSLQMLTSLESVAADYVAMLNPEHQKWNAYPATTRRAIQTLVHLRMKPIRPLVLSIARKFTPKEGDKALRLLVDLAVRYLIVGGSRTGTVEEGMATAAKNVSDGVIKDAKELLGEMGKIAPTDAGFEEGFKVATVSQAYLARYYLRALELQASGDPAPSFIPNDNQDVINLEHVLPKEPLEHWGQFTEDEARAFTRRIGNLALLRASENSDLQSEAFSKKRLVYNRSKFLLTKKIGKFKDWNTAAIAKRQELLASLAVKAWPLKAR